MLFVVKGAYPWRVHNEVKGVDIETVSSFPMSWAEAREQLRLVDLPRKRNVYLFYWIEPA